LLKIDGGCHRPFPRGEEPVVFRHAGELPGTPSTVIDLRGAEPVVLRQGAGPLLS